MTDDPIAIWRDALKDDQHPRHKAAWLLFSNSMKAEGATKMLAAQKEQVIPWLYEILDTQDLYDMSSLGGGYAPANACALLGEWQVAEAAPRLWKIVEADYEEDWESAVWEQASGALVKLGPTILEFILERSKTIPDELDFEVAHLLSEIGQGDERAFEYVRGFFERQKEKLSIQMASELLLRCNSQAGIEYLEARLHLPRYKQAREVLERRIQEAHNGEFDD